jgi:hypothetical protein
MLSFPELYQPVKILLSMTLFKYSLPAFLLIIYSVAYPQDSLQKVSLKGSGGYIEYFPGNMPLIISIPHDGSLLPDEIPERPCTNCAKNRDIYTIESGLGIRRYIFQHTGVNPYVVINNLHRTRLDPNRSLTEAAEGNKQAGIAWNEFQSFIDSAAAEVKRKFGKGLYIDLHGHRHEIKRIELGYLLSSEELQLDNELINSGAFDEFSSIRNLIGKNNRSYTYSELIRGSNSLGGLLEKKGYSAVPGPLHPAPLPGEAYFSGGYNITRHGSSSGGTIDGIQIEIDEDLRSDPGKREKLIADLASVLLEFLNINYLSEDGFKK